MISVCIGNTMCQPIKGHLVRSTNMSQNSDHAHSSLHGRSSSSNCAEARTYIFGKDVSSDELCREDVQLVRQCSKLSDGERRRRSLVTFAEAPLHSGDNLVTVALKYGCRVLCLRCILWCTKSKMVIFSVQLWKCMSILYHWLITQCLPVRKSDFGILDYGLCFYTFLNSMLRTPDMACSAILWSITLCLDPYHCLDIGYLTAMVNFSLLGSQCQNESVIDRILLNKPYPVSNIFQRKKYKHVP